MRLVADRVGCTPMALYPYVDGKDTLLRLMYDAVHAEVAPTVDGADVTERVLAWARGLTDLHVQHHWLSDVSWSRPVLGPHEQEVLESLLRLLQPLALTPPRQSTVASALLTLCRSTGRLIADARHAPRATGRSDEEWWQERAAQMALIVPDMARRFPLSTALEPPDPAPEAPQGDPAPSHLERSARAHLGAAVCLLLAGAMATPS